MSVAMRRLLRLSELMLSVADRKLAVQRAALQQSVAAVAQAKQEAAELSARLGAQRAQTREMFLGAPQARNAVELLLSDLTGLDQAEAQAQTAIDEAETKRAQAAQDLRDAQGAWRVARAKVDRRAVVVQRHMQRIEQAREIAAEAEALEQWSGLRTRLGGA